MKLIQKYIWIFTTLFLLSSCQDHAKKNKMPAPAVPAMKLTPSLIPVEREYIGTTQSVSSVGIRARVKGFLEAIDFTEGKPVDKNKLLFVIDKRPFQAKLDLAEGDLAKSIADRAFQRLEFERMKILVKKGDVSQSTYDRVSAQYKAAIANVEIAQAEVEEAKINLGYCSMHAPFPGIIGEKLVDPGNLVGGTEDTLLATIVQLDPINVLFYPSVSDFGEMLKYRKNMPFKVKVTLPLQDEMVFEGAVNLINNEADVATSTILMRAVIQNPEKLLLPGIYVNLKLLLTDQEKTLLVPLKVVQETQGQKSVYTVNAKNQVEVKTIHTSGQYQEYYIVQSGLNENDIILTSNVQKLKPGEEVTPVFNPPENSKPNRQS